MLQIIKLLIVLFVLLVVGLGIYYFLTSEDEENSLTILEKQWIENNKETLAQVFTDVRYKKKDNEFMSDNFFKALKQQGFIE